MSRRKSIPVDGVKENPNKDKPEPNESFVDQNPEKGFDDLPGTEEVAPSMFDVAAEHIMAAKQQIMLASGFIPDCREKSVAITNFDTALLWFAESLNVAKLNAEIAQQRLAERKARPKYL